MALYCPTNPSELCRMLRLDANPGQFELMEHLAHARGAIDTGLMTTEEDFALGDTKGDALRAALMVVIWRVLTIQGSRATILAPSESESLACGELGRMAMAFVHEVCKVQDIYLSSVTKIPAWNRVEFAGEAGWELRLVPNSPVIVAEASRRSLTALVIDAGNTQPAFVEAQRELERVGRDARGLLIRLW